MRKVNKIFTILVFIFLYIPMILLAIASFSSGTDIAVFKEFTLRQYGNLFRDSTLLALLRNSLIIAGLSSLIATVMGTATSIMFLYILPCEKSVWWVFMSVTPFSPTL